MAVVIFHVAEAFENSWASEDCIDPPALREEAVHRSVWQVFWMNKLMNSALPVGLVSEMGCWRNSVPWESTFFFQILSPLVWLCSLMSLCLCHRHRSGPCIFQCIVSTVRCGTPQCPKCEPKHTRWKKEKHGYPEGNSWRDCNLQRGDQIRATTDICLLQELALIISSMGPGSTNNFNKSRKCILLVLQGVYMEVVFD